MVVSLFLVLYFSIGVSESNNYDRQEAYACITISGRLSVKRESGKTFQSKYDISTDENGYTKSNLKLEREVHKEYKASEVDNITKFKEYTLPSGKRVDYIDFETKTVYELKPIIQDK